MKKLVLGVISSFMIFTMTSFADNNKDFSLEKKYRDSLLSIIESELNLSKSDLAKDGDTIKKINEYINNSLSLDISIEEFESVVKSEVSKNSNIVNNDNYIDKTSEFKDETMGTCSDGKISEYIACAKNFVVKEYDIARSRVNTDKFENYVQDIFDEDFDNREKKLVASKVCLVVFLVVFIGAVVVMTIKE